MSEIKVVNIRYEKCEEYVGRVKGSDQHFGNPFSHKNGTLASVCVGSVEEAVEAYDLWLEGKKYSDIEPERRSWILNNLFRLKGRRLGCFCVSPEYPNRTCHGFVLKKLVEKFCK